MLHTGWQDYDVTSTIWFAARIGPALSVTFDNDNHLFSCMKMLGDRDARIDDVLVDVGALRAERPIRNKIANSAIRAARYLTQ